MVPRLFLLCYIIEDAGTHHGQQGDACEPVAWGLLCCYSKRRAPRRNCTTFLLGFLNFLSQKPMLISTKRRPPVETSYGLSIQREPCKKNGVLFRRH